jgi:hypothetical protein
LTTSYGFTGRGTATYPNGDIYEGSFQDGMRHGEGTYKYISQGKKEEGEEGEEKINVYTGEWD